MQTINHIAHLAVRKYVLDPRTKTPRAEVKLGQKTYDAVKQSQKEEQARRASTLERQNAMLRDRIDHYRGLADLFLSASLILVGIVLVLLTYIYCLKDSPFYQVSLIVEHVKLVLGGMWHEITQ